MNIPDHLLYSEEHEWVLIEGDIATVGITDFAQSELGDIVYVEIDKLEERVEANEVFGSVEAVKTVSDLFSPITGTIIAMNEELESSPEKINEAPYKEGWIVKIKLGDDSDTSSLLSAEDYLKHIGN